MKNCKSNRNCIFTIIGILVVLIAAAALIFVYFEKIYDFFSKVKTFFADLVANLSCRSSRADGYERGDEYQDFADIDM